MVDFHVQEYDGSVCFFFVGKFYVIGVVIISTKSFWEVVGCLYRPLWGGEGYLFCVSWACCIFGVWYWLWVLSGCNLPCLLFPCLPMVWAESSGTFFFLQLGPFSVFHVFLSSSISVISFSYCSVFMTTVILPLSAGRILMDLSPSSVFIASIYSLLMFLGGNLAIFSISAISLCSSALFPLLVSGSVIVLRSFLGLFWKSHHPLSCLSSRLVNSLLSAPVPCCLPPCLFKLPFPSVPDCRAFQQLFPRWVFSVFWSLFCALFWESVAIL